MRKRILTSILAVVMLTTAALGLPLMYTAWLWVDQNSRRDLQVRLDRIATELRAQESGDGTISGPLQSESFDALIPAGGQLQVTYPTPAGEVTATLGAPHVPSPVTESLAMGKGGSLRMAINSHDLREVQESAVAGVALLALASMAAGTAVAVITAQRLSDPLRDVADRAARLGMGDFRRDSKRHAIPELDRVSEVLDAAAVEMAGRLKREHALVADVSHQLRSRLTAIRLRLDELSVHPDPDVVAESEEAMAQVDRLTDTIDELIKASRADAAAGRSMVSVVDELSDVVAEWRPRFADADRTLRLVGDRALSAPITATRLREAVTVLIDNALIHGGGGCTVRVRSTSRIGHGDPVVRVDVADEGRGINNELAPHIFDRGFSGAGSTGVGLSLARALVEADGGRLQLQRRRPAMFSIFIGVGIPPAANLPSDPR
ncbi:MAG: HAMP domain-containing histidine kinase [Mycobacteriaceae bacterium]|nr:HAMP domain-containing histidine kinase [Mycobacteriaceae bacterium]